VDSQIQIIYLIKSTCGFPDPDIIGVRFFNPVSPGPRFNQLSLILPEFNIYEGGLILIGLSLQFKFLISQKPQDPIEGQIVCFCPKPISC